MRVNDLVREIQEIAIPLNSIKEKPLSYEPILERCRGSQLVFIGEATHGTEEFYQIRAYLTQRLIEEEGYMGVAIEWDWPDVINADHYVQGKMNEDNLAKALEGFQRFPDWMWRNKQTLRFLIWLRSFNQKLAYKQKVGIYGLDLYSLYTSVNFVLSYLEKTNPKAWELAKRRYACFDNYLDPQRYGYLASQGYKESCTRQVLEQFMEVQHNAFKYQEVDFETAEASFNAIQNARLVKNAENYYRSLFQGDTISWNIRDQHMFETLNSLISFLENVRNKPAKMVVWCHNSHVGDARATGKIDSNELNIGQLAKEQYGPSTTLIGFTTYQGTVRAASEWGAQAQIFNIIPALSESYEALFHKVGIEKFFIDFQADPRAQELFKELEYLHRAIGVIYRPETERISHYYYSRLRYQYDIVIHLDTTHALDAVSLGKLEVSNELPETYPSGL